MTGGPLISFWEVGKFKHGERCKVCCGPFRIYPGRQVHGLLPTFCQYQPPKVYWAQGSLRGVQKRPVGTSIFYFGNAGVALRLGRTCLPAGKTPLLHVIIIYNNVADYEAEDGPKGKISVINQRGCSLLSSP